MVMHDGVYSAVQLVTLAVLMHAVACGCQPANASLNVQRHGTDGDAAIALVEAATAADVDQYVMVTSLGTGKLGWPAGEHDVSSIL